MSIPTCPQVCPQCSDSPLSVTGNVVGILTFALAMAASIIAFTSVMRGAAKDIKDTRAIMDAIAKQIKYIDEYQTLLKNRNQDSTVDGLGKSYALYKTACKDVNQKLCKFEGPQSSIRKWFAWSFQEKDMTAGMARVRSQMQQYTAVQLGYLSLVIDNQGIEIERIKRHIECPEKGIDTSAEDDTST